MDLSPDLLAAPVAGAIKATANADGSVTLSGLAVVFDEPGTKTRDLTGEYFTAGTYYGAAAQAGAVTVDTLFHHGIPVERHEKARALADAILPPARLTKTAEGWLSEVCLSMRGEYDADLVALAEKGALGWSTGSAGHTVRKTADGEITRWPFVEVSLTPTPAEPRTSAVPLKSLCGPRPTAALSALRAARRDLADERAALHALRAARAAIA